MGKGKRITFAVLISALVAIAALVTIYLLLFPVFTIVSDDAWDQTFTSREKLELRLGYAFGGYRLRYVKISTNGFYDVQVFRTELEKLKSDYVVLGPVATAYAVQYSFDVASFLENSVVLAMGSKGEELFDALLVSDDRSGWIKASQTISRETSKNSQNVALVYDSSVIDYASDLVSVFPSGGVSEYDRSGAGQLFYSNTLSDMDKLGIVIALCPYVGSMGNFFGSDSSVSWIVDYRFRDAVPSSNLYGVVGPDLAGLLDVAKQVSKGDRCRIGLEYFYEKI